MGCLVLTTYLYFINIEGGRTGGGYSLNMSFGKPPRQANFTNVDFAIILHFYEKWIVPFFIRNRFVTYIDVTILCVENKLGL